MDSRKRNFVIGGVIAAALSLTVGKVAAQDYFFPLFGAYVDHVVPGDSPCGWTPVRTITPSTYEDTIMLWYLCEDNRVIARRFFRSGSAGQAPQPVYLVNPPDAPQSTAAPAPTTTSTATSPMTCESYPGFVPGGGGCVPPDHPLAGK